MILSDAESNAMENMSNEDIAKLVAKICYLSKGDTENIRAIELKHLMAVQLLMERVVLTNEDTGYTEDDMALRIVEYMDYMDDTASMFDSTDTVDAEFTEHTAEDIENVSEMSKG